MTRFERRNVRPGRIILACLVICGVGGPVTGMLLWRLSQGAVGFMGPLDLIMMPYAYLLAGPFAAASGGIAALLCLLLVWAGVPGRGVWMWLGIMTASGGLVGSLLPWVFPLVRGVGDAGFWFFCALGTATGATCGLAIGVYSWLFAWEAPEIA